MPAYRGRFAPSPTGPLHFGSLFAAVISYLEAKFNHGEWLIRIEDVDPLREQKNASKQILETLNYHGLVSDIPVIYQSNQHSLYQHTLHRLEQRGIAYACPCSRKYLHEHNGRHKTECRTPQIDIDQCAIKFQVNHPLLDQQQFSWRDTYQGTQTRNLRDDFVLKRKEGFYAYQLAVVCDDIFQEITHVVRGYDLIESTPMQLALYQSIGEQAPEFAHFPVVAFQNGQKLSKQNRAPGISNIHALKNLLEVFTMLGLKLRHTPDNCKNALNEALECWNPQLLYGKSELIR